MYIENITKKKIYLCGVNKAQNYLNVKIMKNLSKQMLIKELIKEKAILREINRTIVKSKITNQAHELYEWKYLTMGGINMLRSLIEE